MKKPANVGLCLGIHTHVATSAKQYEWHICSGCGDATRHELNSIYFPACPACGVDGCYTIEYEFPALGELEAAAAMATVAVGAV